MVQSEDGWEDQVQKLPHEIEVEFHIKHCDLGRAAVDLDDLALAISEFEKCRRMLLSKYLVVEDDQSGQAEGKARDPKASYFKKHTHDWVLAWVDLPLALLYQYRARGLLMHTRFGRRSCSMSDHGKPRLVNAVHSFVSTSL